jgi:hypothetical protein
MLENISLIASIISALAALTTSLRAVGKSREFSRYGIETVKPVCHASNYYGKQPASARKKLSQFFLVTVIWYALSIIFAVPFYIKRWPDKIDVRLTLWFLPFLLLSIVIWIIWRKTAR